jgi:solute carrier family 25 carnitine/acylcarnitine transporter 20/29
MTQAFKDFFAGVCSGWAQVMIMQPFDIIKIRLQTQSLANPIYSGVADCLKKIVSI